MYKPHDPFTEEYDQWSFYTKPESNGRKRFWAWFVDGDELVLERDQNIRIDFEQCNSSAQILDWIFHYFSRISHAELMDMLTAFERILRPRQNFCSDGVERYADGLTLLAKWISLAEPRPKRQGIKPGLRFEILKRDNYRCQMCGATAKDGATLQIDHIQPVSKGGSNSPDNLQVLCRDCNAGKSDQWL